MALAPCKTFTGTIELSTSVAGAIALDTLQMLNGGLFVRAAEAMSSFSAPQLESVAGPVYVEDLPNLESLNFSKLSSINDQLRLVNLPLLSQPGFGTTLSTCPLVTVSGTSLATLDGIDPVGVTKGFNITYNKYLQGNLTLSVSSTRARMGTTLTIMYNGPGLTASFPNLATAETIDLANLSDVSLPLLTDTYEFLLQSSMLQTFTAPKLESVANTSRTRGILLQGNQGLVNVYFPALRRTGGFEFANNNRLKTLTLLNLESARGEINLQGSFENVSFPKLQEVQTFVLNTSSPNFDCSPLKAYKEQGIIEQSLDCGTTKSSDQEVIPSSFSTAAKVGIGVGVGAGVLLFAALAAFVFRRYRRRRAARREEQMTIGGSHNMQEATQETPETHGMAMTLGNDPSTAVSPELTDKGYLARETMAGREANELDSNNEVYELPPGRHVAELSGKGRCSR